MLRHEESEAKYVVKTRYKCEDRHKGSDPSISTESTEVPDEMKSQTPTATTRTKVDPSEAVVDSENVDALQEGFQLMFGLNFRSEDALLEGFVDPNPDTYPDTKSDKEDVQVVITRKHQRPDPPNNNLCSGVEVSANNAKKNAITEMSNEIGTVSHTQNEASKEQNGISQHTTNSKEEVEELPSFLSSRINFEMKYTTLATATLLCYCLAHLTIYEIIYTVVLELTDANVRHYWSIYACIMITGLFILRATGFLWMFLTGKNYRQSKAEIKKQLQQGSWDAIFSNWIDDKPRFKTLLELVGFYLIYISLNFFWSAFLGCMVDQKQELIRLLPSTTNCREDMDIVDDNCVADGVNTTTACEATCSGSSGDWEDRDYEFIYQNVAKTSYYQFSGYHEAPLYSAQMAMIVLMPAATFSIVCWCMIGNHFEDLW